MHSLTWKLKQQRWAYWMYGPANKANSRHVMNSTYCNWTRIYLMCGKDRQQQHLQNFVRYLEPSSVTACRFLVRHCQGWTWMSLLKLQHKYWCSWQRTGSEITCHGLLSGKHLQGLHDMASQCFAPTAISSLYIRRIVQCLSEVATMKVQCLHGYAEAWQGASKHEC